MILFLIILISPQPLTRVLGWFMSWVVFYNHEEYVTCGLSLGLYEESHLV
jgi:hypothetical protein